jgi:hypothetical protein
MAIMPRDAGLTQESSGNPSVFAPPSPTSPILLLITAGQALAIAEALAPECAEAVRAAYADLEQCVLLQPEGILNAARRFQSLIRDFLLFDDGSDAMCSFAEQGDYLADYATMLHERLAAHLTLQDAVNEAITLWRQARSASSVEQVAAGGRLLRVITEAEEFLVASQEVEA